MVKTKQKLKICMLSTMYLRYKNDTRGLMVSEINRNLVQNNIEVSVVAPNDYNYKNFEVLDNVKINRFNYFWPKNLQKLAYGSGIPTNIRQSFLAKIQVPFFALSFLLKTLKIAKKYDIIHAQWIFSGFIGLIAKKIIKKPIIVTVRRVNNKGFMKYINNYVLKNADYVIFNSSYTMRKSLVIKKPKKYSIIHNSIDTEKFKPIKTNLRKRLSLENKKILFSLGLLVEKKGFPYLIRALPEILKKHKNTVLLIGGSGKEEQNLKDLVKELNLEKEVKFLGTISADKTAAFYNICDIFVLPSIIDSKGETETLGVVLLEALACGKPVIATNVGGIPDVVTNDVGVLIEQKNSKQLEKAIINLLSKPKHYKKCRERIKNNFSDNQVFIKMNKVYEKIL